jgi:large subunit ribosomal protein L25
MTTARPTLSATRREILGKHVARLRKDGQLPAVVFGQGVESEPLTLDGHAFGALRRSVGPNALIDLSIDGKKPTPVLIQSVQLDKIRQRPLHVDLFAVRMTEELTVDVPLVPDGVAPAVELLGGNLLLMHESVRVRALPDRLPQSIALPLAGLIDFDASVRASELVVPPEATLLTEPDEVLAKVQAPRVEVEEVVAPAAEAEGEAAEAEAEGAAGPTAGAGEAGESESES